VQQKPRVKPESNGFRNLFRRMPDFRGPTAQGPARSSGSTAWRFTLARSAP